MSRQLKTSKALATIVMEEIGLHSVLKEIQGVTIRRCERHNENAPNWEAVFELTGYDENRRPIPVPTPHPRAYEIVRELQGCFDLV